jgi:hypothetical protein
VASVRTCLKHSTGEKLVRKQPVIINTFQFNVPTKVLRTVN